MSEHPMTVYEALTDPIFLELMTWAGGLWVLLRLVTSHERNAKKS